MSKFFSGVAVLAALCTGLAASPSLADGAVFTISTPQSPCGVIMVFGDNNNINCDASNFGAEPAVPNGAVFLPQPTYQRRASATCVTPQGNFRMPERLPYYVDCEVQVAFGVWVAGWAGNRNDSFFYPPML